MKNAVFDTRIPQVHKDKKLPEVFYKKAVLKNFEIFTRKHLCWSLFSMKLQGSATLLKRDSSKGVFL